MTKESLDIHAKLIDAKEKENSNGDIINSKQEHIRRAVVGNHNEANNTNDDINDTNSQFGAD